MKTQKIELISFLNQLLMKVNVNSYFSHKKVLVIFILFLAVFTSQAQQLQELGKMLSAMNEKSEVGRIESLISDLQPTVYISNEEIKNFGETAPICADLKASAVARLSETNPLYRSVELITIRIEQSTDLSASIDLFTLSGFTNLKYIQILCSITCTPTQIANMIKGNNSGIKVFYLVSIPS